MAERQKEHKLWTRDFTILTLGSVVSLLGNDAAGFAMSLMVLDYTGSPFYYAVYLIVYMLPSVIMPILSGPFLDRFSRKKTIYTLDFISAGLYLALAAMMYFDLFRFGVFAIATFLLGSIDAVYSVAYESFYPMLITPGNYTKAYSISGTLEELTFVMMPVSAFIYNTVGITWLFIFDAVTYLIAAVFETKIRAAEDYTQPREEAPHTVKGALGQFRTDFKEGLAYLKGEKGLLAITIYFMFSFFSGGAEEVVELPFFKDTFENGEYWYALVGLMHTAGRVVGGLIHYKVTIPTNAKWGIALFVYITISVIGAVELFFPLPVMAVLFFAVGILGVTSYNIRISATQSYVPNEKKGRFNGTFNTLATVGTLVGQALAGVLATVISGRTVLAIFMAIGAAAAVVLIGGNKKSVSAIYNTQA